MALLIHRDKRGPLCREGQRREGLWDGIPGSPRPLAGGSSGFQTEPRMNKARAISSYCGSRARRSTSLRLET